MKIPKASMLAITAALSIPHAVNASVQCVPLKPALWDKACVVGHSPLDSEYERSDSVDWLTPLYKTTLGSRATSVPLSVDSDGDLGLLPIELEVPGKLEVWQSHEQETPATDTSESLEEQT